MILAIGADHAGYALKEKLRPVLEEAGHTVVDVGAHEYDRHDDYHPLSDEADSLDSGEAERGILVCGSGVGASIAANKILGARACLCHDIYSATQGVEHDDMNVLCLGGLIVGEALARKLVDGFLSAEFIGEGRFQRRLDKVKALETNLEK